MPMPQWPQLREELDLLDGPSLADGQPSWTLHDPTRNQFFRIDWPTFEILQRWSYGSAEKIVQSINDTTLLHLTEQDVLGVIEFLSLNQLLKAEPTVQSQKFAELLARRQGGWAKWLLHNYLFIRIPIWRPDPWLTRWQGVVGFFYTRPFWWLTLAVLVLGLIGVGRQSERFWTTLVDSFSLAGVISYAVALVGVKFLHELGHAFTAKRYGCRVPTMGLALVVMWPMAYTDTNEVWRLTDNRQRLAVASAGIVTELMVAVWATLAWVLLPDGVLRGAAFILATTTWVATLAINASPFMRFDGYYIISDGLDMPNLHERSFALARWWMREKLFDLKEQIPEHLPLHKQRALIAFAFVVWIYRLVVFLGIAALVYTYFSKALGLFLFLVEIAWFVLMPFRMEIKAWIERKDAIRASVRSRRTLWAAVALLIGLLLPWPGSVDASAVLRPAEFWTFFTADGARLESMPFKNGDRVQKGDVVAKLAMPDLASRNRVAEARLEQARAIAISSAFDADNKRKLLVHQEMAATAQAQLDSVETENERYAPVAPFDGVVRNIDPDLRVGQWLSRREAIGTVVRNEQYKVVETWLDESVVQRVSIGAEAKFIDDAGMGPVLRLKVTSIDRDASPVLPRGELAAQAGGHLMVHEKNKQLVPEHAVYRVVLTPIDHTASVDPEPLANGKWRAFELTRRGRVLIDAQAESPLIPYLKRFLSVVIREFGS